MSDCLSEISVRQVLQAETRDLHLRFHDLPVFRDLLGQRLSIERYRSLLARLYGFYLPLDAMLSRGVARLADDVLPDPYQERAPYLREDLARLGQMGEEGAAHEQLPRCASLPVLRADGDVLGWALRGRGVVARWTHPEPQTR
ncbi:MAG: biliverdin-producing heme oxygenase [Proteobacteria bacterium]|nr:biliverdin-producing heme oxygenase [Pseudomonadota bacterium]